MSDGQMPLTYIKQAKELDKERIWRLATAAERERCAKLADYYAQYSTTAEIIAEEIRTGAVR